MSYRIYWLIVIAGITVVFSISASNLPLVTTLRDLIPDSTPGVELYDPARKRFGGDESAFVLLEAPDHFTESGLNRLRKLSQKLKEHPLIDQVISALDAQELWLDEEDSLVIDYFDRPDRTPEELRNALLLDKSISSALLSKNSRYVLIVVRPVPSTTYIASSPKIYKYIQTKIPEAKQKSQPPDIIKRRWLEMAKLKLGDEIRSTCEKAGYSPEFIHSVGFTPLITYIIGAATSNLTKLMPMTILVILLMLYLLLQHMVYTLVSILCIIPATIWAIALGGLYFGQLTLYSSMAPIMVLVVGTSDVVHLVTQFQIEYDNFGDDHDLTTSQVVNECLRQAFSKVGLACTLTSLTTFLGFATMLFVPLPSAQELGLTAGIGVIAAYLLSFILTPIFLSFTKPSRRSKRQKYHPITSSLRYLSTSIAKHPIPITIISIAFTIITLVNVSFLTIENSLTRKLFKDHPIRVSTTLVENVLGSSGDLELLISADKEDGLKAPEVVQSIAKLQKKLEEDQYVHSTFSYIDVLSRIHELMAPDLYAKEEVPADSREQIAQYLWLFELSGGKELRRLISQNAQHARIIVRGKDGTAEELIEYTNNYDKMADGNFAGRCPRTNEWLRTISG